MLDNRVPVPQTARFTVLVVGSRGVRRLAYCRMQHRSGEITVGLHDRQYDNTTSLPDRE